jgi:hypothetical protein
MPVGLSDAAACQSGDHVLVIGGNYGSLEIYDFSQSVLCFDLNSERW